MLFMIQTMELGESHKLQLIQRGPYAGFLPSILRILMTSCLKRIQWR
ncbi:hypothetical protein SCA6_000525 [Theobroma cacao]